MARASDRRRRDQTSAGLSRFAELCAELAGLVIPESIQHDDLHLANLYLHDGRMRVLDWGDSSIAHPFFSLVVTFRFLDEVDHLAPSDPWFTCLRDAYLEPWGGGLTEVFDLAIRWAPSRTRLRGRGSGIISPSRNDRTSTGPTASCCDARSRGLSPSRGVSATPSSPL